MTTPNNEIHGTQWESETGTQLVLSGIDCCTVGFPEEYDTDGNTREVEDFAEYVEALFEEDSNWKLDQEFREFQRCITERRMSKEGRFLRMQFRTRARIDQVPDGALASGVAMVQNRGREGRLAVRAARR